MIIAPLYISNLCGNECLYCAFRARNKALSRKSLEQEEVAREVMALARIVRPESNIPSTTALATLNLAQGRELGLCRGANIVMPNLTPTKYRALYEIYPAKAGISETARDCHGCMLGRIQSIGRQPGQGPGHSSSFQKRTGVS